MSEFKNKQPHGITEPDDVLHEIEQDMPEIEHLKLQLEQAHVDYANLKQQFAAGDVSPQDHNEAAERIESRIYFLEMILKQDEVSPDPVRTNRLGKVTNFILRRER